MAKQDALATLDVAEIKAFMGKIAERTDRTLTTVDGIAMQLTAINGRVRSVEQDCAVLNQLPARIGKVEDRVKTAEEQIAEARGASKALSFLASLPGVGAILLKVFGG